MLIPERYIATWKKPDILLIRLGFLIAAWMVTACVVTDEIEFYDKINMPAQLVSTDPPRDIIGAAVNGSNETFSVTLWEPDEKDETSYRGVIRVIEELNSGQVGSPQRASCDSVTPSQPDPKKYDSGIMVTITCTAEYEFENAPDQTTVIVEIVVNDREFEVSSEDDARQLTITWTRELYPENDN